LLACGKRLESPGRLLAHHASFAPESAHFSPLFILQTEVIKDAISRGLRMLDLLPGNAPWQQRRRAKPNRHFEREDFVPLHVHAQAKLTALSVVEVAIAKTRRNHLFCTHPLFEPR
jgi:CelD/BcsL family acetyltransferase involved in cellulose biosynthesis